MRVITENIKNIISLCKRYKVRNLYVFGSVLTNRFNERSDIDFLFNFSGEIDYTNYADNYFNFWEDMKNLLGREIDLVDEKTLKNPIFRQEVESTRQLIYG